jgi:adenosyl cobinamide kinase/adenosyl cobinamide phosphate guanylyltransferase
VEDEARAAAAIAAQRPGLTVTVSNEVGLGIVPVTPLGRRYRDVLGRVNAIWVDASARALFVVAGRALPLEPA